MTPPTERCPLLGTCCACGYGGDEEPECPAREDGHCEHWWELSGESEHAEPNGYALVMETGEFVGIWRQKDSAEAVHKSRMPSAPNERIVPVYFHE